MSTLLPLRIMRNFELTQRNEVFSLSRSTITNVVLKCFVKAINIPKEYKLLAPTLQDRAAYPPPGYVAISRQHLQARLRLSFPGFLIDILNLLKLASFQLSPNSYSQFISLYLMFLRHDVAPPSDNIIKFCFTLKKNPSLKNAPKETLHDNIRSCYLIPSLTRDPTRRHFSLSRVMKLG
ncbi:hypothetical protein ACOSQ2_007258 [Xanthoceras sorbifolium]